MSAVIYKYSLPTGLTPGEFELELPVGSEIIRFASSQGDLCVWAAHASEPVKRCKRQFMVTWTGHSYSTDDHPQYIGSTEIAEKYPGAGLVFHLFEVNR
jgi:hypothetical protein